MTSFDVNAARSYAEAVELDLGRGITPGPSRTRNLLEELRRACDEIDRLRMSTAST